MLFYVFLTFLVFQRLVELVIAQNNERWMVEQGAYEVGKEHYKYIVLVHVMFILSLLIEVVYFEKEPSWWSWVPFLLFLFAQVLRVWSIASLGKFWNTKILILPQAQVIQKGPYRFFRHPNYIVVAVEILVIPLIFQAFVTAILFSLLNSHILLSIRIPMEEKALKEATNYAKKYYLNKN